jgi:tRNA modification GTPase
LNDDTIAAIATAIGASSIGIIRISGNDAGKIANKVFRAKSGVSLLERPSYSISYGSAIDENNNMLDEVLALTMWAPHSFTGEDVVEIQCHGGTIVLRSILELILRTGARLADPGEFSKRAFLNGKLDLSQAEAIMDIINAKTETALYAAANNIQGDIKKEITDIRMNILRLIAYLEADIDFPEEDINRLTDQEVYEQLQQIEEDIKILIETFKSGRILREGLKTVLIGRPNVGKSSIMNAFLKEKRAIVTDIPGTTRDVIEEYYNIKGMPLILVDTAGLRDTDDIIEKLGVERTKDELEKADLILYVFAITELQSEADLLQLEDIPKDKLIVLINKHDLLKDREHEEKILRILSGYKVVLLSATENYGIEELKETIIKQYDVHGMEINKKPLITNTRHKDALLKGQQAIRGAKNSVNDKMPSDFISIDLRQALLSLGEISGETLEEDIVEQIFSQFCLGK